jgi:hypothetical protein
MIMVGSGSRQVKDKNYIFKTLDVLARIMNFDKFYLGDAKGADTIMAAYCLERDIEFEVTEADWATHGKAAGPIRNGEMLQKALGHSDGKVTLVAFPHRDTTIQSRGTWNTIQQAREFGHLKIFVFPSE